MPQGNIHPDQDAGIMKNSHSPAKQLAMRLIELSGGPDNVLEASHCTTRIRLRLRNSDRVDEAALSRLGEVQNVFVHAGQLQIIVGPALVFKVQRQIMRLLEDPGTERAQEAEHPSGPEELTSSARATEPGGMILPYLRRAWNRRTALHQAEAGPFPEAQGSARKGALGKALGMVSLFSDIIVPIIPLFIVVGLLLGLVSMLKAFGAAPPDSMWFQTLSLLTSSAFQVLAVMFGYQAAKRFGGTPVLGAAVGIVMTRLHLLHLAEPGGAAAAAADLTSAPQFGYQGTMIPIILAVLLMTLIEKGLRRIIPATAVLLTVPFLSFVMGCGFAILVIGPLGAELGGFLSGLLEQMFQLGRTLFGLLLGGAYGFIVMTGLHHGIQAIEIGLISNPDIGVNFLLPIWSMANIAQGGAGLAVYARTRDSDLKKIALPASLSAFFGITEPIAFGVNLKLGRPFLGAAAGGA
ncbi:PTS transporter subunit EIIC, partial [Paenibacillus forsythiae]